MIPPPPPLRIATSVFTCSVREASPSEIISVSSNGNVLGYKSHLHNITSLSTLSFVPYDYACHLNVWITCFIIFGSIDGLSGSSMTSVTFEHKSFRLVAEVRLQTDCTITVIAQASV